MFARPKTPTNVWFYTFLASLVAVVTTFVLVSLSYELTNARSALIKACLIAFVTSTPIGWFFCNEMRKNVTLNEMLREMVNRDRLTDAATRDYFFEKMEAAPENYGVSLMVDIDHFKSINDQHGHLAGDEVIRRVAALLGSIVRDEDIVCRFGGEEFIVFLAKHKAEEGVRFAERIRESIEEDVILLDGTPISVTVSIGASLKERITDINQAIKDADDALYRAKEAGRNRTIFAA